MDKLVIRGGRPLRGSLHVGGSKNTALPLMAAAVLAEGRTTLNNVPVLQDVFTFANVLRVTGCHVEFDPDSDAGTPDMMVIDAGRVGHPEAPYERLGLEDRTTAILGVRIPYVTIPLVPGKNVAVLAEVVAMNHLIKASGKNAATALDVRLSNLMKSGTPYSAGDAGEAE